MAQSSRPERARHRGAIGKTASFGRSRHKISERTKSSLLQRNHDLADIPGKLHAGPSTAQCDRDTLFISELHPAGPAHECAAAADRTVGACEVADLPDAGRPSLQPADGRAGCKADAEARHAERIV